MADRQTAIGAFVFGGLVLAFGAVILFGNFRLFSPTTKAAVVFQGSISGLSVGAPVTFRGVRVGAVEGIVLDVESGHLGIADSSSPTGFVLWVTEARLAERSICQRLRSAAYAPS